MQLHAVSQKDKPAIIFEGQALIWSELWRKVEAASAFFVQELGVERQQIVDLLLTNSPEFVIAYLGILHAGHIALPLDPAYKRLELDAIIEQIPPKLIVTDARYISQIGHHKMPTVMIDELLKISGRPDKVLRLVPKEQIASLTFTSGTSGRPKAVPNTHANHAWNIDVCSRVWDWTANDSLLISLPLSHWYGLAMGLSGAIYHGNTLYLQQQAFHPEETLKTLASGNISMFTHVPLAYIKMLEIEHSRDYDLSKVRLCISGGAPLPPAVWHEFKDRYNVEILEAYGSSETGRIAANSLDKRVLGSPGRILPGVQMKLGKDNEVQVKSEGVFPGYWHNRAATKAATTNDGYWRTGDIGEIKDGCLFLKGRAQEKIRRFSYSISPRDVEWAVHQHPQIKEIHVMGRQTGGQNDELIYFVSTDLTDEDIRAFCKENLIFSWRPDRIIRLPEIPRTRNGKPRISALREMLA